MSSNQRIKKLNWQNSFGEHQQELVAPTEIQSMEKYQ